MVDVFEKLNVDPERAAVIRMKSDLVRILCEFIRSAPSAEMAAEAFGISIPGVDLLLQGRIDLFPLEHLVMYAGRAGIDIQTVIRGEG